MPDETTLIEAFRASTPENRARLLKYARGCASGSPSPTREELLALARSRGMDVAATRIAIARAIGDPVYELRRVDPPARARS